MSLDTWKGVGSIFPPRRMLRKPLKSTAHVSALFACSILGLATTTHLEAQPAPGVVAGAPVAPGTLNRMFNEAEAAFAAKDYTGAVTKIEALLAALGPNKDAPLELLYFNIGLGNLLAGKSAEAEAGFAEALKRFPKGEYASRSWLGIGRASIDQGTPEKKERAIEALKLAAADPRFRSEAGLWLGQVYTDLGKRDEALAVFKSLMGSDIRSPQQTTAAVEVIGLLADTGKLEDLILYLDRLSNQAGVRDAIAWYANQVIVRGDELVGSEAYEAALVLYRSIPPRSQILEIQKNALESERKDLKILETRVEQEKNKPLNQRSTASELVGNLKPAIELAEKALAAVEEKTDLDAALLMRRGRCLFYLDRFEEALVCFRTIRTKYESATDAKAAAYAEIVILNKLQDIPEIKVLCDAYLRKYPDADNVEQVATTRRRSAGPKRQLGRSRHLLPRPRSRNSPSPRALTATLSIKASRFSRTATSRNPLPFSTSSSRPSPNSPLVENALYYMAMSNFLPRGNKYKETLASCKEYLSSFPDGRYAGDMRYRLAFIDFNDKGMEHRSRSHCRLSEQDVRQDHQGSHRFPQPEPRRSLRRLHVLPARGHL